MIVDFSVPLIDFINIKLNEISNSYKILNPRGLNPLSWWFIYPSFKNDGDACLMDGAWVRLQILTQNLKQL